MDEITIKELKKIRDYFGVNDASIFNQMAFSMMDKHIKALDNLTSSSRIIERSQPELNTKMKRLMGAVTKLHPTLAMDDPKHQELYLSLHSLKESVTSL